MGRDKGSLKKEGKLWVETLRDEVKPFGDVFLSVGEHNVHFYQSVNGVRLILDQLLENLAGPFVGLLSARTELQSYDKVLVLPCDMINLKADLLQQLLASERSSVFSLKGELQSLPLCLSHVDLNGLKDLENRSVYSVLNEMNLEVLDSTDSCSFLNFNSERDLR